MLSGSSLFDLLVLKKFLWSPLYFEHFFHQTDRTGYQKIRIFTVISKMYIRP
jgi:hypothetical protein